MDLKKALDQQQAVVERLDKQLTVSGAEKLDPAKQLEQRKSCTPTIDQLVARNMTLGRGRGR